MTNVLFETKDKEIKLNVKVDQDTIWFIID
jgi:hypothetical protein